MEVFVSGPKKNEKGSAIIISKEKVINEAMHVVQLQQSTLDDFAVLGHHRSSRVDALRSLRHNNCETLEVEHLIHTIMRSIFTQMTQYLKFAVTWLLWNLVSLMMMRK